MDTLRGRPRTAGFVQVDLGLIRRFAIGRATQGTLAFQPTQAGPSRQFQLTARVIF